MDNHEENVQFWNSLLQSLADSSPKDDLYPEISSPMLAMCTPMAIDEPAEPWKVLGDHGDKEMAAAEKTAAKAEDKNMNEMGESSTQRAMEKGKGKEEGAREDTMTLSKRARSNEAHRINEKRRRIDIKNKIDKLKELTRCQSKKDVASSLDAIIDNVRELKFYVEGYPYGPMMPIGMGMDYSAPWTYPYVPPNYVYPNYFMPFHHFTPGETSGSGNQIVPYTNQRFNNQPLSQSSQFQPPFQSSQFQPSSQPPFQPSSQPPFQPPSQFQPSSQQPSQLQYHIPSQPQSSKPM